MPFDKPVKINQRTWEHVLAAVQRVEATPYPSRQPVFFPRLGGGTETIHAISTSSITPCNSNTNTYGHGTCQPLMVTNANSNTNTYNFGADTSFNSNSVLVLNPYTNNGNSINSGVMLTVGWRSGYLLLVGGDQC